MTHPFSGWRGSSCDVCNDGLRYLLFNEFGRLLFRGPTNFTHEDDSIGLAVLLEQCESVDHVRPVDGIAADSDARRLSEACLAHRVDDLEVSVPLREITPVSPSLKMRFGMMPILAWPGDAIPGQFGPIRVTPLLRAKGTKSRQS